MTSSLRVLLMETNNHHMDHKAKTIAELKIELELERKARKKAEISIKKMEKELLEEKNGREALERACKKLGKVITSEKAEMNRVKKEIEDERKMLGMAEVLREERVQMKLTEARLVMEEKMLELSKQYDDQCSSKKHILAEKNGGRNVSGVMASDSFEIHKGRFSPEPENPHIRRGIKGFVEFPKVVRALGSSKSNYKRLGSSGTKLECEKTHATTLFKPKAMVTSVPINLFKKHQTED